MDSVIDWILSVTIGVENTEYTHLQVKKLPEILIDQVW
jgi:hypothetical protein